MDVRNMETPFSCVLLGAPIAIGRRSGIAHASLLRGRLE
jgi:hypothetical protein